MTIKQKKSLFKNWISYSTKKQFDKKSFSSYKIIMTKKKKNWSDFLKSTNSSSQKKPK